MKGTRHSNAFVCAESRRLVVACFLTAALSGLVGCSGDSESDPLPVAPTPSSAEESSSSEEILSSSSLPPESSSEMSSSSEEVLSSSSLLPESSSLELSSSSEEILSSSSLLPESSETLPESSASLPESHATVDGITILVDSSFFMEKFHSSSVKIAFNDDETSELNYIEIDGNTVRHEIIATSVASNHPQFSPDGSKLAFSTGFEGLPKQSELFVVDLASAERTIYKLEVESAAVPRWRILENGDTAIQYNDYTGSDQDVLWNFSGTYVVTYSNNTFGTPQKAFNRSYNGGISSDNTLAVSGLPRLLFHYATDDDSVNVDMYNEEQVCNVSLTRDTSKIVSFLDARGSKGVEFTQDEEYYWHQYVFYMDYSGEILKAIRADGGYVFNATEWLFIPGYQVGTLTAQDGTNKHVVLIDYEQGGYALILNAPEKEIVYPDIWVDEK